MSEDGWHAEVLDFWFGELTPEDWFSGKPEVDRRIEERFAGLCDRLVAEGPEGLAGTIDEILAAIIVLDQFTRNVHRRKAEAFAGDRTAIVLARKAVAAGLDRDLPPERRGFLYMPFMHSEVLADQEECIRLFGGLCNEESLKYAIEHRDIVARFGRFPHRNRALGRASTEAELAFLKEHAGYGQ